MKTRRGGMWAKSDVDRKVEKIVRLFDLGHIPLTRDTDDLELKDELRTILRGVNRSALHSIIVKLKTYPHSERFVEAIRTMGGKRRTKRGGWPWSASKEDAFADEIIANLFNENYPFTEKINNYNLEKVMDKLIEKGESSEGETRNKIIARLRQMKAKNNGYERNAWTLSKMI
jgi:hypothetical protein